MSEAAAAPAAPYRILDGAGVTALLAELDAVRERLGGAPERWTVREVGDGNLNLVFLVDGPHGSVCVKQALPYVRVAGPSWPMSPQRAFFEYRYYCAVAPYVGRLIPAVYHYDPQRYCLVMERLSPHIILRQGLIGARRYPRLAVDLGEYVARASFFTCDLAAPFESKLAAMASFAANQPPIRISVDLIFTDPYRSSERNRHTSPQLDALVGELRADAQLKVAASRLGHRFLSDCQALVHGDLHSGSVMVTEQDSRIIDPEFAFYGPIGFDLGAFFGNLLLSWYSQPGHARPEDDRRAYQSWILEQARAFWLTFRARFLALWTGQAQGDAFPGSLFAAASDRPALQAAQARLLDGLFADMLGFAACKMIRRIVGFAHVADFESIADPARRAACEAGALHLARALLVQPERFEHIEALLEAVPRFAQTRCQPIVP